jgi:uncharacterized repeat protein (TIGR02543 family)
MKIKVFGALVLSAITMSALAACTSKPAEPSGEDEGGNTPAVEKVNVTYHYNYPFISEEDEGYVEEPEAKVVEVVKGAAIEVEKPTLEGYKFAGWYAAETTAIGEGVDLAAGVQADTEVYARWTAGDEYETWSVVGGFGHDGDATYWSPTYDAWVFSTEDGIHYTYVGKEFDQGVEWKAIANMQWNSGELGGGALSEAAKAYALDAGNIKMKEAGVYTITLDLYKGELGLTKTADGGLYAVSFEVYLLGDFNSWNTDSGVGKFEAVDGATVKGTWRLENFVIESEQQFKVVPHSHMSDESVNKNWVGPKSATTAGMFIEAAGEDDPYIIQGAGDDPNFVIGPGTYNFEVTINNPWLDDMVATAAVATAE